MGLFKRRRAERALREFVGPDQAYPDLPEDEAVAAWAREMHKALHWKNMPHDHGPDNNLPQDVSEDPEHLRQHASWD